MHAYYEASKSHSHIHYAYSIVCIPTMTLYGVNLFTNNIMVDVHSMSVHKVSLDGHHPEQKVVLEFGGIKSLHHSFKLALQPTNVPFYLYTIIRMHLVVCN